MSPRAYKCSLGAIAVVLMVGASVLERNLNHERDVLGLTRYTELTGAPPVLAMTTVALGGFRGLISNALWIRANDLQDDGKYFEMVQLADWITKLEPHFTQVWLVQAWNMAYNISVKFKDPPDRWRWVQRGIELLRDEGLQYNPDDVLIHRELAWFYQHKMGANLDDAHLYYKQMWANEMSAVLGTNRVDWDALIHPKTPEEIERTTTLRARYKLDPVFMKMVNETNGPLEWRLPEAHAIYWAQQGLEAAKRNERKINPDDLITLRRVIYQSMQLSFQRGRLIANQADRNFEFGPNLEIIGKVSAAYEQAMKDDAKNRDHIQTAHRNFLRDAVWFLYVYNRMADAQSWYKYLAEQYPNKTLIDFDANSYPRNVSLDTYALGRIQEEVGQTSPSNIRAILEGLDETAVASRGMGEYDKAVGYEHLERKIWDTYNSKILGTATNRVPMATLPEIRQSVLDRDLDHLWSPAFSDRVRAEYNLPPRSIPASTNSPAIPIEPNKSP
jgi:hypothetical protein